MEDNFGRSTAGREDKFIHSGVSISVKNKALRFNEKNGTP